LARQHSFDVTGVREFGEITADDAARLDIDKLGGDADSCSKRLNRVASSNKFPCSELLADSGKCGRIIILAQR
jgi:hypothetical protein